MIDVGGLAFVTEARKRHLVPGLRVEVQKLYGQEGLVAYNAHFEPGGC